VPLNILNHSSSSGIQVLTGWLVRTVAGMGWPASRRFCEKWDQKVGTTAESDINQCARKVDSDENHGREWHGFSRCRIVADLKRL
jgi:hypothetical protein